MSTDQADPERTSEIGRRLPSRSTVRDGLITFVYLTTLIVGLTVLVTLELVVRL